jgi:putative transposase
MLLSFKTALIPNNRQITAFRKASGVARHGKFTFKNTTFAASIITANCQNNHKFHYGYAFHK